MLQASNVTTEAGTRRDSRGHRGRRSPETTADSVVRLPGRDTGRRLQDPRGHRRTSSRTTRGSRAPSATRRRTDPARTRGLRHMGHRTRLVRRIRGCKPGVAGWGTRSSRTRPGTRGPGDCSRAGTWAPIALQRMHMSRRAPRSSDPRPRRYRTRRSTHAQMAANSRTTRRRNRRCRWTSRPRRIRTIPRGRGGLERNRFDPVCQPRRSIGRYTFRRGSSLDPTGCTPRRPLSDRRPTSKNQGMSWSCREATPSTTWPFRLRPPPGHRTRSSRSPCFRPSWRDRAQGCTRAMRARRQTY